MSRTILTNLRVQMSSALSSNSSAAANSGGGAGKHKADRLMVEDKKKWPSENDFGQDGKPR